MKKIKKENLALKKEVISFLSDEKLKAVKGNGTGATITCPTTETFECDTIRATCGATDVTCFLSEKCGEHFNSYHICEEPGPTLENACIVSNNCHVSGDCQYTTEMRTVDCNEIRPTTECIETRVVACFGII